MTTRQPTPGVHENFASEISSSPDTQSQKWFPWNGGDMPVPRGTAVEVILRYGKQVVEKAGGGYATRWYHDGPMGGHDDIVFYRLYTPTPESHVQPPEDWLLVPRVASKEMQEAAMHYVLGTGNIYARDEETVVVETTTPGDVWRAMLDAAPAPPQPNLEPLFWYRPVGEDGGYEGPHHALSTDFAAIPADKRDQWKPLYPVAPAPAPHVEPGSFGLEDSRLAYQRANAPHPNLGGSEE